MPKKLLSGAKKAGQKTRPGRRKTQKKTPSARQKNTSQRATQAIRKITRQRQAKTARKGGRRRQRKTRTAQANTSAPTASTVPYAFPPPVSSRPEQLPLSDPNWTWDGFQAFGLDLLSRHPATKKAGIHHFGKQGDAQDGIDLFADMTSGEHCGFQSKKVKRFTEADTRKAIKVTTYKADRYVILLSIEATAAVRKVVGRRRKWDVWDVRDISQKVRELPLEEARRLLDTHFGPAWRKAFLGSSAVSTFPTAEVFFQPLLDPTKLFNHTWSLVGRSKQVQQLHSFVDSSQYRIAILTGRGGIGKTKLLHAFSQEFPARHTDANLRFVVGDLPVTPESLEDLPLTPCVVVVDDAHRREDLGVLLSYMQQRSQPLKLVFSSRPQGLDHLNYLLRNAGFDPQQVLHVDPVADLSSEEVRQLALQILGKELEHLADSLTAITKDCPLVTVVGGKLLAAKAVDPQLMERDDDFRAGALLAFSDVLVGEVGQEIEPDLCRRLLNLLAAIAPVPPESELFRAAAAEFLRVDVSKVVNAIDVLERHGVLLRRGYSVRIVPDVLADHLLHDACLTSKGKSKGFAQQVFEKFFPICPTQVFRNLAELDWRVHRATGEEPDVLATVWHGVREEFEKSNNLERCQILDLVKEVAYYQPAQVLEIGEYAIRNPATTPDRNGLASTLSVMRMCCTKCRALSA